MKLNKLILITSAILLGTTGAFADDFDSFDDFGSFGSDASSGSATKLEVNGTVKTDVRAYVDTSDKDDKDGAEKIDINAIPSASLDLKYSGNKSDLELKLKLDETTIKNNPVDVIDEAVIRGYFNNLTLEAGKMKIVWGKGDKLHVLDNFLVSHAEALFFVHNQQAEIPEPDILRQQPVGADDDVDFSRC